MLWPADDVNKVADWLEELASEVDSVWQAGRPDAPISSEAGDGDLFLLADMCGEGENLLRFAGGEKTRFAGGEGGGTEHTFTEYRVTHGAPS